MPLNAKEQKNLEKAFADRDKLVASVNKILLNAKLSKSDVSKITKATENINKATEKIYGIIEVLPENERRLMYARQTMGDGSPASDAAKERKADFDGLAAKLKAVNAAVKIIDPDVQEHERLNSLFERAESLGIKPEPEPEPQYKVFDPISKEWIGYDDNLVEAFKTMTDEVAESKAKLNANTLELTEKEELYQQAFKQFGEMNQAQDHNNPQYKDIQKSVNEYGGRITDLKNENAALKKTIENNQEPLDDVPLAVLNDIYQKTEDTNLMEKLEAQAQRRDRMDKIAAMPREQKLAAMGQLEPEPQVKAEVKPEVKQTSPAPPKPREPKVQNIPAQDTASSRKQISADALPTTRQLPNPNQKPQGQQVQRGPGIKEAPKDFLGPQPKPALPPRQNQNATQQLNQHQNNQGVTKKPQDKNTGGNTF